MWQTKSMNFTKLLRNKGRDVARRESKCRKILILWFILIVGEQSLPSIIAVMYLSTYLSLCLSVFLDGLDLYLSVLACSQLLYVYDFYFYFYSCALRLLMSDRTGEILLSMAQRKRQLKRIRESISPEKAMRTGWVTELSKINKMTNDDEDGWWLTM